MISFKLIVVVFIVVALVIREISKDARKKNVTQQPTSQKNSTNDLIQQWWGDIANTGAKETSPTDDFSEEKPRPVLSDKERRVTHDDDNPQKGIIPSNNEPETDIERWRRAVIDSEILKTKF